MTLFLIVFSSLLFGATMFLSLNLRRKKREFSEYKESSLHRYNQLNHIYHRLFDSYKLIFDSYKEEKESLIRKDSELIVKCAELSVLKQKMATSYVVHQVIIQKAGKEVLCLAEVIHADSLLKAFSEFKIRRDKRLKDNKINPVKCGYVQVHRVFPKLNEKVL